MLTWLECENIWLSVSVRDWHPDKCLHCLLANVSRERLWQPETLQNEVNKWDFFLFYGFITSNCDQQLALGKHLLIYMCVRNTGLMPTWSWKRGMRVVAITSIASTGSGAKLLKVCKCQVDK